MSEKIGVINYTYKPYKKIKSGKYAIDIQFDTVDAGVENFRTWVSDNKINIVGTFEVISYDIESLAKIAGTYGKDDLQKFLKRISYDFSGYNPIRDEFERAVWGDIAKSSKFDFHNDPLILRDNLIGYIEHNIGTFNPDISVEDALIFINGKDWVNKYENALLYNILTFYIHRFSHLRAIASGKIGINNLSVIDILENGFEFHLPLRVASLSQ